MDLFTALLAMTNTETPCANFGRSLLQEDLPSFSIMAQGDTIHATDGDYWIIYPDISRQPEEYSMRSTYFIDHAREAQTKDLQLRTKAYYQATNTLFQKNAYFPEEWLP